MGWDKRSPNSLVTSAKFRGRKEVDIEGFSLEPCVSVWGKEEVEGRSHPVLQAVGGVGFCS